MFARSQDMLRFFDTGQPAGQINTTYWVDKLVTGPVPTQYSPARFTEHVLSLTDERAGDLDAAAAQAVRAQVHEHVLRWAADEDLAVDALDRFEVDGSPLDPEMDRAAWTDLSGQFLLTLHALAWAAKTYHQAAATVAA